jgi:hypothetical protein
MVPPFVKPTMSPTLTFTEAGTNFRSSVSLRVDTAVPLVTATRPGPTGPPPLLPPDELLARPSGGLLPQALSTSTSEVPTPSRMPRVLVIDPSSSRGAAAPGILGSSPHERWGDRLDVVVRRVAQEPPEDHRDGGEVD